MDLLHLVALELDDHRRGRRLALTRSRNCPGGTGESAIVGPRPRDFQRHQIPGPERVGHVPLGIRHRLLPFLHRLDERVGPLNPPLGPRFLVNHILGEEILERRPKVLYPVTISRATWVRSWLLMASPFWGVLPGVADDAGVD